MGVQKNTKYYSYDDRASRRKNFQKYIRAIRKELNQETVACMYVGSGLMDFFPPAIALDGRRFKKPKKKKRRLLVLLMCVK